MATYNDDGSNSYEPGESNDRAVPPEEPPVEGGVDMQRRPAHPIAGPPDTPSRPGGAHPEHPIAPTPAPKHRG
jgi:hypothetical protein